MSSFLTILVTFVRHGQTEYNVKHLAQGQYDVPLNEKGINQSILAGKALSKDVFDFIYSSDLSRAYETATKIVEESCFQRVPITQEILLRETSHGIFENGPGTKLKEAAIAAGFSEEDRRKFRPPGGENQDDVALRASTFLFKVIEEQCLNPNGVNSIVVVSHGLFLRELFKILLKKETSGKETIESWENILVSGTGPNTGISKFTLKVNRDNCDLISTKCSLFLSNDHLKTCLE
jgi:probable phosphoglycerate mutase